MSFDLEMRTNVCSHCGRGDHVWSWDGMTYNLAYMFRKAGFYDALKQPFERWLDRWTEVQKQGADGHDVQNAGVTVAVLRPLVEAGLEDMLLHPEAYRALDPPNKWGDFSGALEFTKALAKACREHPDGVVFFSG